MNQRIGLVLLCVLLLFAFSGAIHAETGTKALWEKVAEAQKKGLPQTAIDNLKQIYRSALAGKRHGEAMKALSLQIVMETTIKGNKPEYKVQRLREEISRADESIKPLMNTLLAQWYWHYYERNRYRFMNRTATEGLAEDDFTTWDLPKLFREISRIYQDLLKNEQLKTIKVADYLDVLDKGNQPLTLRPTVFDFVAWKALEFYTSAAQAGARPEDSFQIDTHSGAFADADAFMHYNPSTTDTESPKLLALRIYQKLMLFHAGDSDRDPFIDADIARLVYVFNIAAGDDRDSIFASRMKGIAAKYPSSTLSSLALYYQAKNMSDRGALTEAHSIASQGLKAHPDSYGAELCSNLISSITARALSLKSEQSQPEKKKSRIHVTYRNIDMVTFRIVRDNWKKYLSAGVSMAGPSSEDMDRALGQQPVAQWTVPLKPTADYKARSAYVEVPELPLGLYRVIASYRKDFAKKDNSMFQCFYMVTSLAVVTRKQGTHYEGFVVDSQSGEPQKNVTVNLYWLKDYNQKNYALLQTVKSDENGVFTFSPINCDNYIRTRIHAFDDRGSEYLEPSENGMYRTYPEQPYESVVFFTDRAIYRPGQTVHFKGILINVNKTKNNYEVIPGRKVAVIFRDVNSQEIARQEMTSNDYGSLAGSFTAPADRLMGAMSLCCHSISGSGTVRVEEYKRPKFTVELKPPKESFRLGDTVTLKGLAQAYTGAPIDGSRVSWRVTRQVQMPYWWGFFWHRGGFSYSPGTSQEMAHGVATTDGGGNFSISFMARPDEKVPREGEPTFIYQISADVTDSAGETRSDQRTIRLGYTAMEARLAASGWLVSNKVAKVRISTATLDGVPAKSTGTVEVASLKQPSRPVRTKLSESSIDEEQEEIAEDSASASYLSWPDEAVVDRKAFATDDKGNGEVEFSLKPGVYRAKLISQDRYGTKVTALLPMLVFDPGAQAFPIKLASFFTARDSVIEAGETFTGFWGTGYEQGRAFVEVLRDGKPLKKYWTSPQKTQSLIDVPILPDYRGGLTVMVSMVRENRLYTHQSRIVVPWSNKKLDVSVESLRSKLTPGGEETCTIRIKGPGADRKAAEIVAAMYDASLEAFISHYWPLFNTLFSYDRTSMEERFSNNNQALGNWFSDWYVRTSSPQRRYINFISGLNTDYYGYQMMKSRSAAFSNGERKGDCCDSCTGTTEGAPAPPAKAACAEPEGMADKKCKEEVRGGAGKQSSSQAGTLDKVQARKNLAETAFFYPQLLTDKDGTVKMTFTMPEALTKWRLLAFAHGKGLESGLTSAEAVTQKDLMVQPNAPRFFREGDQLFFTVKVTNMGKSEEKGAVRLSLFSPDTGAPLDREFGNSTTDQDITIPAGQSKGFSWKLSVPEGITFVGYRAVASAGNVRDGEEAAIPILSRRIAVQEAVPLWIRGPGEKKFSFDKLRNSASSATLVSRSLTVQMTSNPAWYAVQALPYLMEFPHECSEQVFNRLYANSLARHIAQSDPKIRKVFDEWKNVSPDALRSNLEKNQDLKSVMLLETPWVLDAKSESQAKRNVGVLFEDARMQRELAGAYDKLRNMQLNDGSWPWFPGGRGNSFITLYVVTGFGRLKHLGVTDRDSTMAYRGVDYLDRWIVQIYRDILKYGKREENHLSSTVALYLYGRSFFLKEKPIPQASKEAVDYFLGQAARYWLKLDCRMSQGHLALALSRFGDAKTAHGIMASIRERAEKNEEMGMFWSEGELSWWWYRAPIETQALMIEAFDEIMHDEAAVEDCKVWLLKQKQTQDWKTTKATSDSIYALLLRGDRLLASDALVQVSLGGQEIKPEKAEAGTGFYEKRFDGPEIKPQFGEITVKKEDKGIAWGGVHWQYCEDIGKVTPHRGNPLSLKKAVFVQRNMKSGPVIEPVKADGSTPLEVGDLIKIRIELRTDRDMEYVHMRDGRGSGLEPVNVISSYRAQGGLYYYESTKDTATHFYIDYLPKGTYIFEYPLRIAHRGKYQNDMAHIECMYAPEFNSHSESVMLEVK